MEIDAQSTAVVAVHLQGDVVTRDGAFGGFFAGMVESTGLLGRGQQVLSAARDAGATVAYTRITFSEGHPELIVNNGLFGVVAQQGCCVEGTPGTTVVSEVAPVDGDLDIGHHRVSGATGSGLIEDLCSRHIETVLIFGVATNLSVEATARELSDAGFRVVVVADCCTAADRATHDASIASLGLLVAEVTDASTVISALRSGVPA
jgi:nicotinamidase-related amidase